MSGPEQVGMLEEQIAEQARTIDNYRNEVTRLLAKPGSERVAELDRATERIAELVTEGNELRAQVASLQAENAEHLRTIRNVNDCRYEPDSVDAGPGEHDVVDIIPTAVTVVTAGTEHLTDQITRLVIPDEEN